MRAWATCFKLTFSIEDATRLGVTRLDLHVANNEVFMPRYNLLTQGPLGMRRPVVTGRGTSGLPLTVIPSRHHRHRFTWQNAYQDGLLKPHNPHNKPYQVPLQGVIGWHSPSRYGTRKAPCFRHCLPHQDVICMSFQPFEPIDPGTGSSGILAVSTSQLNKGLGV